MPNMQLRLILILGNTIHEVATEADAELLLASDGPLSCESALLAATDELRRKLAVRVSEGAKGGYLNPIGLGDK